MTTTDDDRIDLDAIDLVDQPETNPDEPSKKKTPGVRLTGGAGIKANPEFLCANEKNYPSTEEWFDLDVATKSQVAKGYALCQRCPGRAACEAIIEQGLAENGWKPRHQLQAGKFYNSRGIPVSPNRVLPRRRIVEPIPLFPLSKVVATGTARSRHVA